VAKWLPSKKTATLGQHQLPDMCHQWLNGGPTMSHCWQIAGKLLNIQFMIKLKKITIKIVILQDILIKRIEN
jgi:hypothetical protein